MEIFKSLAYLLIVKLELFLQNSQHFFLLFGSLFARVDKILLVIVPNLCFLHVLLNVQP